MTSLVLGEHKQAHEHDTRFHGKPHLSTSYSFDTSHDPFSASIKVQSSKAVPSSSVPQFFHVGSHCKISESSSCQTSANNPCSGVGGSPPSFDEQLDVNSIAAVSVAALQRALQEAEMKISLARQFLEHKGQGVNKLSFKDTLKAKVTQDDQLVSNLSELRPLSCKNTLRAKVENKNDEKDVNEIQLQKIHEDHAEMDNMTQSFPPEMQDVSSTAQLISVFDVPKKPPEDGNSKLGESSNVSEMNEEGDGCQSGGEWEATKHLNQPFGGIKNRITSFTAWQADAEKKGDPKIIEKHQNPLHPSEEIEPGLEELEIPELKEDEDNTDDFITASNTDNKEDRRNPRGQ